MVRSGGEARALETRRGGMADGCMRERARKIGVRGGDVGSCVLWRGRPRGG